MERFTPGPWRIDIDGTGPRRLTESKCELACVPHMAFDAIDIYAPDGDGSYENHLGNCHLIAAAPEMLAALKSAEIALAAEHENCGSCDGDYSWPVEPALLAVRAAIAKATA